LFFLSFSFFVQKNQSPSFLLSSPNFIMNKGLILIIALCALFAIASARPLVFYADQTDSFFGIANGWNGVATAFATRRKGQNNHRVRFFGTNHITEKLTDAWLMFANGTVIADLQISTNDADRYFLGDVTFNETYFGYLLDEKIYATVASANHTTGAISGYFRSKPHSGVAYIDSSQELGTSTSTGVGYAWAALSTSATTTPQDILDQDAQILADTTFNGRIVHNNTGTTSITFNGVANTTQVGAVLATATLTGLFSDGKFNLVTPNELFYALDTGDTYYEVIGSSGNIRGQIYPLVSPSRRYAPYRLDQINGATSGSAATLRHANLVGSENNPNSYVACTSTGSDDLFTYTANFYFPGGTSRNNFEIVRGYTIEFNLRIEGEASWFFEIFDASTQTFLPLGTIEDIPVWTPMYVDYFPTTVAELVSNRKYLIIRVSTSDDTTSVLQLDLFSIREWVPSSLSNQFWKAITKILFTLDSE
jgi:hypothetical protein